LILVVRVHVSCLIAGPDFAVSILCNKWEGKRKDVCDLELASSAVNKPTQCSQRQKIKAGKIVGAYNQQDATFCFIPKEKVAASYCYVLLIFWGTLQIQTWCMRKVGVGVGVVVGVDSKSSDSRDRRPCFSKESVSESNENKAGRSTTS